MNPLRRVFYCPGKIKNLPRNLFLLPFPSPSNPPYVPRQAGLSAFLSLGLRLPRTPGPKTCGKRCVASTAARAINSSAVQFSATIAEGLHAHRTRRSSAGGALRFGDRANVTNLRTAPRHSLTSKPSCSSSRARSRFNLSAVLPELRIASTAKSAAHNLFMNNSFRPESGVFGSGDVPRDALCLLSGVPFGLGPAIEHSDKVPRAVNKRSGGEPPRAFSPHRRCSWFSRSRVSATNLSAAFSLG